MSRFVVPIGPTVRTTDAEPAVLSEASESLRRPVLATRVLELPGDEFDIRPPERVYSLPPAAPVRPPPEIVSTAMHLDALDWVGEKIPANHFANTVIVLAAHGFRSIEPLIAKLIEKGADASRIIWAPVPYSTNPEALRRVAQYGVHIVQPAGAVVDWPDGIPTPHLTAEQQQLRKHIHEQTQPDLAATHVDCYRLGEYREARLHQLRRMLQVVPELWRPGCKVLVADDGGLLTAMMHQDSARNTQLSKFEMTPFTISAQPFNEAPQPLPSALLKEAAGTELTTRGITEMSRLKLGYDVVDTARSEGKKLERRFIAESLLDALLARLPDVGITEVKGKRLLIVGQGWIGSAVAELACQAGFDVTVHDRDAAVLAALEKSAAGKYRVTSDLAAAASQTQIVLGCTGQCSITADILKVLRDECLVASGSSGEVEIDVGFLAREKTGITARQPIHELTRFKNDDGTRRAVLGSQVDGIRTHYLNGKRLYLASGGRPINMTGGIENIPPEKIQLTRALQLASLAQARSLVGGQGNLVPLDRGLQQTFLPRLETAWATLPEWRPRIGSERHRHRQERWQNFCEAFARGTPASSMSETLALVAQAAPNRYPKTPDDAGFWCRLFEAPDGTLMFRLTDGGTTLPLPIQREEIVHVELLHHLDDSYRFALFTKTASGESVLRTITVDGRGDFMPYESLPAGHRIEVTRELKGAELSAWHVEPWGQDRNDPGIVEAGTDIWPMAFGTHPFEAKKLVLRHQGAMLEVDADGAVKGLASEDGRARHNRVILDNPPRLLLQTGPRIYWVNLPKQARVVDLRSHLNLDLVVLEAKDGAQALMSIEWAPTLMPEGWPRGDAPSPDTDPIRRFFSSPKEPHSRFWIGPGSLARSDSAMLTPKPSSIAGAGVLQLGMSQELRISDSHGDPTVQVFLLPGAAGASRCGYPNSPAKGHQRILIQDAVTADGRAMQSVGSMRIVFNEVSQMDPRRVPSRLTRGCKAPGVLPPQHRFRDARFDTEQQCWLVEVETGRPGDPESQKTMRYYPSAWVDMPKLTPGAADRQLSETPKQG